MSKINRGSEWRKWDLHIHTPESFHWNEGKKFVDMSLEEELIAIRRIIDKLNSSDVAVFSVMDYFTFDGFLKIRKYLEKNPDTILKKTLFPGIELRIEAPVNYRLNIHAIFSDDITDQELGSVDISAAISATY